MNKILRILQTHFWAAFLLLAVIRLLQIFLNFAPEFGGLFRPEPATFAYSHELLFILTLTLLFAAGSGMKNLVVGQQNRLLLFFSGGYLLIGLLHNRVGQRSYLCELIDGNLHLDGLSSLLTMDFFFQPPFIFWGLAWQAVTFVLATRAGIRHWLPVIWSVSLLGVSTGDDVYPLIFCVSAATASLAGFRWFRQTSAQTLHLFWFITFSALMAYLNDSAIIYRNSWLVAAVMFPVIWLPGFWLIKSSGSSDNPSGKAVGWLIPAFCGLLFSLTLTNVPLGRNLLNLWFSLASLHFVIPALIPVLICLLPAMAAGLIRSSLARPVFVCTFAVVAVFYLLDALVMFKTGLRLNYQILDWALSLNRLVSLPATIYSMRELWPLLGLFAIMPFLYEGGLRFAPSRRASDLVILLIIAALAAPLYRSLNSTPGLFKDPLQRMLVSLQTGSLAQTGLLSWPELRDGFLSCGIDLKPSGKPDTQAPFRPMNLLLIMLESTTSRYVSLFGHDEPTWPQMAAFKDRMEIFPFFFAGFPESSNADFSLMSGLYPPDFLILRRQPELPATLLVDHLKNAGYDCSMFFSGYTGDTGLASFYRPRGFARIYDAGSIPGARREDGWIWGLKEHFMVDRIASLLHRSAQNPQKPFFVYYRMLFPHAPFLSISDAKPVFNEEGHTRGNLVGRFKNCLLYQDAQLARLMSYLDQTGLASSTLVAIVSDHGTMLGEAGKLGHGWSLAPELANVPFLLIRPEADGFKVNHGTGSHADVLPTLLGALELPAPTVSFCQGRNLLAASEAAQSELASRTVFLSSMNESALISNRHFYWFGLENQQSAAVFSFSQVNGQTRFVDVTSTIAAQTIAEKQQQSRRFLNLQRSFLLNLPVYNEQLVKLTASGSADQNHQSYHAGETDD